MSEGRRIVAVLTLLSFTACTTLRPMEDFSPSRIRQQVEAGDEVHIVARSGTSYDLTVTDVMADALEGRSRSGKRYRVVYEAIQYIEVEEADIIGSVGTALTTVYVVVTAIVVYVVVSWSHEND